MIDHYSFGSMSILGIKYGSDLKIINGETIPDWWRMSGHTVDVDDVTDILSSKPDYVVFGSGKVGLMKVSDRLQKELADMGVEVFVERSGKAMNTFNRLYGNGKKVAAGFHLTC